MFSWRCSSLESWAVIQCFATLGAFAIMQKKHEPLREYYRHLTSTYFQGHNAPGLEEEQVFKALFLNNLHDSVHYNITDSLGNTCPPY